MHINDNVFRNLEKFSARSFDSDQKFSTAPLTGEQKLAAVKDLVDDGDFKKQLDGSVDKILLLHRNTKIFLFMMTGPFLVIF